MGYAEWWISVGIISEIPKNRRSVWIRFCFHPPFWMELVNDVLDMNKLESGQIKLEESHFPFLKY